MIEVLSGGLQTTVQDAGRRVRALGIPAGGAADATGRRLGNALVGNAAGAAGLELTLGGPTLRFTADTLISLCGAPFHAQLDGSPLPGWRGVSVQAGQVLRVEGAGAGARAFLAVRGGLDVPVVFGSRGTDLRGGFGGLDGRALRAGDRLAALAGPGEPRSLPAPLRAFVPLCLRTPVGPRHRLRVLPTADATPALLNALLGRTLAVSAQVDRMGARLDAGAALRAPHEPDRVSVPNVPGLLQVPPDGRPILLLPDAGTHGGYPAPLVVISADLPRLGQLRPGDRLSFQAVTPAEARQALWMQERALAQAVGALKLWAARP